MAFGTASLKMPVLSTGNFANWRVEMYDVLSCHSEAVVQDGLTEQIVTWDNLKGFVKSGLIQIKPHASVRSKGLHCSLTERSRRLEHFRETSLRAAIIICAHVPTNFLQRVPTEDLLDAPRLLAHLKAISQPFRFLDLPTELRRRVYSLLPGFPCDGAYVEVTDINLNDLPEEKRLTIFAPDDEKALKVKLGGRSNIMGPISQVCATMRAEAAEEIFKRSIITFGLPHIDSHLIDQVLRTWFSEVGNPHLQHIHRMALRFGTRSKTPKPIRIEANEHRGLTLDEGVTYSGVWPALQVMAVRQKKQLDALNKAPPPGTRGEAIRNMLLHDPWLWATNTTAQGWGKSTKVS